MNTNYTIDDVVANWHILLGGLNEETEWQLELGLDKNCGSLYYLPALICPKATDQYKVLDTGEAGL